MRGSGLLLPLSAGLALLAAGCVSALREPPPVTAIGGNVPNAEGRTAIAADVDRLVAEAEASFARRPDTAAVRQAREQFLAAARADETRIEGLLGAARVTAWLIEHQSDPARRVTLSTEGVQTCQWCVRRSPESTDCRYRLALALGQQARERPSTASDALPRIVALLLEVVDVAPRLDEAGGDRVLALLLLRAPGWPAGPGDPESGLAHARKAVEIAPEYPPNLLALGEALAANGKRDEARAAYRRAAELASAPAAAADPDSSEWAAQARAALGSLG